MISTFQSGKFHRLQIPTHCACEKSIPHRSGMVAIDNWEELLECEDIPVVVRAHKNRFTRLATAAVSVFNGNPTYVLPDTLCWGCINQKMGFRHNKAFTLIC